MKGEKREETAVMKKRTIVLAMMICVMGLAACGKDASEDARSGSGKENTERERDEREREEDTDAASDTDDHETPDAEDLDIYMTYAEIPSGDYVGRASDATWEDAPHSWFPFSNESGIVGCYGAQLYLYSGKGDLIIDNIDIAPELVTNRNVDCITIAGTTNSISYEITFYRDGTAELTASEQGTGLKISDTYHCDGVPVAPVGPDEQSGSVESPFASYEGVAFAMNGHGYDGTQVVVSLDKDETIFTLHYEYAGDGIVFDDVIRVKNSDITDQGAFYEIAQYTSDSGAEYQITFGYESIRITSMSIVGSTPDGKDITIETAL